MLGIFAGHPEGIASPEIRPFRPEARFDADSQDRGGVYIVFFREDVDRVIVFV